MTIDISRFMHTINNLGGVARSSHFLVEIASPPVLNSVTSAQTLSLLCRSTTLPGIAVGTDDRSMPQGFGVPHKMPWGVMFSDMDLTFIGDNKGVIHNLLTQWVNSVVLFNQDDASQGTTSGQPFFVSYKNKYATSVIIRSFDESNQSIMEFKLHDCFPTAVYDVQGDWSSQNDTVQIRTRFSYTRWTVRYQKLTVEQQQTIQQVSKQVDTSLAQNSLISQQDVSDSLNTSYNKMVSLPDTQAAVNMIDNYKRAIPLLGGRDYFAI